MTVTKWIVWLAFFVWVAYVIFCSVLGRRIGRERGQEFLGGFLGWLFGPLGLIAASVMPLSKEVADRERKLQAIENATQMARIMGLNVTTGGPTRPTSASSMPTGQFKDPQVACRFAAQKDLWNRADARPLEHFDPSTPTEVLRMASADPGSFLSGPNRHLLVNPLA